LAREQYRYQLLFILQQSIETGERPVGRRRLLLATRRHLAIPFRYLVPRVLIVVTVEAQQLPVAAVGRIIIVVVIFVMDCEFSNFLACEFAPASRTDPRKKLERSLSIGLLPTFPVTPSLGNDLIRPVALIL
jgi:hypothetical protein